MIGWSFHAGALRALRHGAANMDVLVSLGTNAAYAYSVLSAVHRRALCQQARHRWSRPVLRIRAACQPSCWSGAGCADGPAAARRACTS